MLGNLLICDFLLAADFFKINFLVFFKKFFEEYHQSAKQFGSRLGLTFCYAELHLGLCCLQSYAFRCHIQRCYKKSSENVICCIYILMSITNFGIQTNNVDPDQTAPRGTV